MILTLQLDNRDTIQISTTDNVTYRVWGTHGTKWREWELRASTAPNIITFLKQLDILADTMIEQIG